MEVTYGTDTLTFMGIKVKEPLMILVRKFWKAFGNNILQFRTRRVDNDFLFEECERLYPSLPVRANGMKDGMEVVMTVANSSNLNKTGGASQDRADNEPDAIYQASRSEEPLSSPEEEKPSPEQKYKKRKDNSEDKAYHPNSDGDKSGNDTCTTEDAGKVLFLKVTSGRKKQHQTPSDDGDEEDDGSSYSSNK